MSQKTQHHHCVIMVSKARERGAFVPVLLDPTGKPITAVTKWALSVRDLKAATLLQAARAIGFLYDYCYVMDKVHAPKDGEPEDIVHDCLELLRLGTIDPDGHCPVGLFWRPKGEQFVKLKRYIATYANYLLEQGDGITSGPVELATRNWLRNHGGLLNHLSTRKTNQDTLLDNREVQSYGDYNSRPVPFPSDKIQSFIVDGSRRERVLTDRSLSLYSREYNVRDQLAKVLVLGGGLRSEELFHIYGIDVSRTPEGLTTVRLFHPDKGVIRNSDHSGQRSSLQTRADFLWDQYRILPRNRESPTSTSYAGWKNLLLIESKKLHYTMTFWIHPAWGDLFWSLHRIYVRDYLSRMKLNHPFYFVSIDPKHFGEPWSQGAFTASWRAGVERIGLDYGREYGTTPHGGRHAYGQEAADIGIDPRIRQMMMHHRNILSQLRYQRPSATQVNDAISAAQKRIISSIETGAGYGFESGINLMRSVSETIQSERHRQGTGDALSAWFRDPTDPTGIFASWDFYQNLVANEL